MRNTVNEFGVHSAYLLLVWKIFPVLINCRYGTCFKPFTLRHKNRKCYSLWGGVLAPPVDIERKFQRISIGKYNI